MLGGGGGGDILSGWRGTNPGSIHVPRTTNELSDEIIVGKVYDNRVVRRLLTYIRPYKKDAVLSLAAVLVYTAAHVGIPLVIMLWINWGVNSGVGWRRTLEAVASSALPCCTSGPNTFSLSPFLEWGSVACTALAP